MFSILSIFWFFREAKYILFWVYLWQLKEYHIPRLVDHFRTHKGRQIILNPFLYIKVILFLVILASVNVFSFVFLVMLLVYLAESALFLKSIFSKTIKRPVKTSKTGLLLAVAFIIAGFFITWVSFNLAGSQQLSWILAFDIFTPFIVSAIVLAFQPIFVFARNNILRRAEEKVKTFKNLTVIAITGSYGKTSTKEFLATILSSKFNVASTKEHQNSEMGIANCILNDLNEKHQIFIVEMGAYKKGGIKLLCDMVKPKIGIVTGINEQHLALFGSLENLLSAEGGEELAEALPKNGVLVVNGDNKYCLDLLRKSSNLPANQEKKYVISNKAIEADIWTEDVSIEKKSVSFLTVNRNKELGHFKVNVLGKQNVQNLLGAILVAREQGMSIEEIAEACKKIKPDLAGMVLKQGKNGLDIIDSSYSANPDGVFADLEYLSIFPQKKAIIMPCLIELGPNSAEIHRKIGKRIAEICNLAVITTKDKFEDLKSGAMEAGMSQSSILFCENPDEISTIVSLFCKSGDAILIEGRVPGKVIKLLTDA